MQFTPKHFDPLNAGGWNVGPSGRVAFSASKSPDGLHVYDPKTILALNVALATQRPLLISGEPGSGKSTLARNAAAVLGWRYYKQMITSRLQAADLLCTFDALRRLSDAQSSEPSLLPNEYYVEPGRLWWAFDPESATMRGTRGSLEEKFQVRDPALGSHAVTTNNAVVLLDEIDKADPDVPNDLLEPFDLKEFTVRETNDRIRLTGDRQVLMILTTNGEREMPPAFLRRCVVLSLDPPDKDWFVAIANLRRGKQSQALHEAVAEDVMALRTAARKAGLREPSTSEYLDTLAACDQLNIDPQDPRTWVEVRRSILWKQGRDPDLGGAGPAT